MMHVKFASNPDYNEVLEEELARLEDRVLEMTVGERADAIEALTDAYIERSGIRPKGAYLSRMASLMLREVLSDPHPDKMTRDEYPVMSIHQLKVRQANEWLRGDWNMNRDKVTGYRVTHFNSDDEPLAMRQPIFKRP